MNHTNNEIWYAEQREIAIKERDAAIARAVAAEAERDALRAQLAAQEWRSVDEPPTESGDYLVWVKHEGVPGFFSVAQWMKRTLWENNFVHPTYWRLLPPPPPYSKRYGAPQGDAS